MAGKSDQSSPGSAGFRVGSIGSGNRIQIGKHLTWVETPVGGSHDGARLESQFKALAKRLAESPELDVDTRELAVEKVHAVSQTLANPSVEPSGLRRDLLDAKAFLSTTASWAWDELRGILSSDAATKVIDTISEATVRAMIKSVTTGN